MTRKFIQVPMALMLAMLITAIAQPRVGAQESAEESCKEGEVCGEYGTSVVFAKSPAEAAKKAFKDEKLVFVLHVSGNFETPDYT